MKLYLDSANIEVIKEAFKIFPLSGVTTNPSLIVKEKEDYLITLKKIADTIPATSDLHIQLLGRTVEEMMAFAYMLEANVRRTIIYKVPVNEIGLIVMKKLIDEGKTVTATAIITASQAYLASLCGVHYVAPYFNRIENVNGTGKCTIKEISSMIQTSHTQILAASFKNMRQVTEAIINGSECVTVPFEILKDLLHHPLSEKSIAIFQEEWDELYGK